jgi:chorismate synthase
MNIIGDVFKIISFGESHGPYVGCVIDGTPANLPIDTEALQTFVNKRKATAEHHSTQRMEDDNVEIISGLFEKKTLGSPICILIKNQKHQSTDYDSLKNVFRPSHADYTYQAKYGIRDYRGGGRSSIRAFAPIVAAGDIARQLLAHQTPLSVLCYVKQIGTSSSTIDYHLFTKQSVYDSPLRCPDAKAALQMQQEIEKAAQEGDTLGGIIQVIIQHAPVGLGEPLFGKLQAKLSQILLSINTVKAIEFGSGMSAATMKGSEHNDIFYTENNQIKTKTNHSGGIQGGISNGMDITLSLAFKPISSIQVAQETITQTLESQTITIGGRHDVCALPRAVPIVEALTYIALADLYLQRKLNQL